MDCIYGNVRKNGIFVENLKTVGEEHSNLNGFIETVRTYDDGTTIKDRCRILEHYHSYEKNGICYDWYYIDSHYRETSSTKNDEAINVLLDAVAEQEYTLSIIELEG